MRSSSGMVLPKDGAKKRRILNNRSTKGMFSKMAKALVLINTVSALEVAKTWKKLKESAKLSKSLRVFRLLICCPLSDMVYIVYSNICD